MFLINLLRAFTQYAWDTLESYPRNKQKNNVVDEIFSSIPNLWVFFGTPQGQDLKKVNVI